MSSEESKISAGRRQFSLRTLFAAITILCVILAGSQGFLLVCRTVTDAGRQHLEGRISGYFNPIFIACILLQFAVLLTPIILSLIVRRLQPRALFLTCYYRTVIAVIATIFCFALLGVLRIPELILAFSDAARWVLITEIWALTVFSMLAVVEVFVRQMSRANKVVACVALASWVSLLPILYVLGAIPQD